MVKGRTLIMGLAQGLYDEPVVDNMLNNLASCGRVIGKLTFTFH